MRLSVNLESLCEPHCLRGPFWTPVTPKTGSLFHADQHSDLIPVCAPNFLPPDTDITDTDDWASALLHSDTRPNDWARWAAVNRHIRIDPTVGQHFESSNLLYEAAIAGLGIAIGIRDTLQRELSSGLLVEAFPASKPANCPFYLIRPPETEAHTYFPKFRNWIIREVEKTIRLNNR